MGVSTDNYSEPLYLMTRHDSEVHYSEASVWCGT